MKQWEENRRHIVRILEDAAAARCGFCKFMECRRYPLMLQLNIADMEATYLDEKE